MEATRARAPISEAMRICNPAVISRFRAGRSSGQPPTESSSGSQHTLSFFFFSPSLAKQFPTAAARLGRCWEKRAPVSGKGSVFYLSRSPRHDMPRFSPPLARRRSKARLPDGADLISVARSPSVRRPPCPTESVSDLRQPPLPSFPSTATKKEGRVGLGQRLQCTYYTSRRGIGSEQT